MADLGAKCKEISRSDIAFGRFSQESAAMKMVPMFTIQAAFVATISVFAFKLGGYDLKVPFVYSGDSVVILMYVKGLLREGWPTVISQLSAPFSYSGAAFPLLTSVDWLVMKGIALFTGEPGLILNLFWLLTLIFSALTAAFAGYQLGLNRSLAVLVGVLYAFLPYALLRNVSHLNLVYYLVPLLCLLAVIIYTRGDGVRNARQGVFFGFLGCVLQGFGYIYYSFFSVLIFGVAAILGWKKTSGFWQLRMPLFAMVAVSVATTINLVPYFVSVSENGPPPDMNYKFVAEAEIYGAKLRKMIAPHPQNVIKPFADYAQKDAQAGFPNENENQTARLGMFGSVGLALSMLLVLRGARESTASSVVFPLASLSIATFFVISVGGVGAVINLLTVSDIRTYNRFSVFLSFFSMVALALWLQSWAGLFSNQKKQIFWLAVILFALFSLYDQLLDRGRLLATQQSDIKRAREDRMVVEVLEKALPSGASVLQLPLTGYPPLAKFHTMESYDHGRAYLWSNNLRWSWPSFSVRHRAWQSRIAEKHGIDFIHAAILSGFQAIWIDRAAYADNGAALISELNQGRVATVSLPSERFVVFDLRDEAAALRSSMTKDRFDRLAAEILGPEVVINWNEGFYGEERSGGGFLFRWSNNRSRMTIRNLSHQDLAVCLKFVAASPHPGTLYLTVGNYDSQISIDAMGKLVVLPISSSARNSYEVDFRVDSPRLEAAGDPRSLYFFVRDYRVDLSPEASLCSDN